MGAITNEMLNQFSSNFHADEKNSIRQHAVVKSGLSAAAENLQEHVDNPMIFSI